MDVESAGSAPADYLDRSCCLINILHHPQRRRTSREWRRFLQAAKVAGQSPRSGGEDEWGRSAGGGTFEDIPLYLVA